MGTAIGVGGFSWEEWAFRWETCLSPPGHCDPLSPLLPMYDLISSPVTPSSFCLPIFLLHLEMDPNVTQRVVDGEGKGSGQRCPGRYHSRDLSSKALSYTSSSSLPPGEGKQAIPPIWMPIFLPKGELPYPHILPLPEKSSPLV